MKIMIEDVESLKFFTVEGQWAKNAADGKGYSATRLAFKAAKQEPIGRFNIVGYIPSTRQFVNLDHGHGKGGATAVPTVGPVPPEAFIPGPAPSQGLAAQEVEAA